MYFLILEAVGGKRTFLCTYEDADTALAHSHKLAAELNHGTKLHIVLVVETIENTPAGLEISHN